MDGSVRDRLLSEHGLLVAEGYLFEFEARGYLQIGAYVPEVVLEYPELVRQMHQEFVHAGSDVVLAFTFYAHREKMRLIGREADLEQINKMALKIAREVANETGKLMAGNLSTTTLYDPNDETGIKAIYDMFKEQVKWAVEGGADYIVAETFDYFAEADLALKAISEFGYGIPAVVTLSCMQNGLYDGVEIGEACRRLHDGGAVVVGLNCSQGPSTMLSTLRQIRQTYKGPLAALPVCYRTDSEHKTFEALYRIDNPEKTAFPVELNPWLVGREEVATFSREAWQLGVRYMGLCCGNRSHYMRTMAEAIGRTPPASRFSPDMSQHYSRLADENNEGSRQKFTELYKVSE